MAAQRNGQDGKVHELRVADEPGGRATASGEGRGFVTFVGAGPGDPDLITLRGWRALERADRILYDSLVDLRLLAGLRAECVFVGKRCGQHSMSQQEINELLAESALAGEHVARLKGGDPGVLGRVGEEALYLTERGVPFEIIPGVSSATAVPELAGIPVTHRGLADSFVVATAHRRLEQAELSIPPYSENTTLVLLMARATAPAWCEALRAGGYPPALPVALVSAGCTARQRVAITSVAAALDDLRAAELDTPLLAVVGRVVTLHSRLASAATREAADDRPLRRSAGAPSGPRLAACDGFETQDALRPPRSAAAAP